MNILNDFKSSVENKYKIIPGYESIDFQKDLNYIDEATNILDGVGLIVNDFLGNSKDKNYIKKMNAYSVNNINDSLNKLSIVLGKRFGIPKLKLVNDFNSKIANIYLPNLGYENIIDNINNINSKYYKDLSLISKMTQDKRTTVLFNTMSSILKELKNNKIEINLKSSKIKGIENTEVYLTVNTYYLSINGINGKDFLSAIVKEIGVLFNALEDISDTVNTSKSLLESFIKIKGNTSVESIKLFVKDSNLTNGSEEINISTYKDSLVNIYKPQMDKIEELNNRAIDFISKHSLGVNYAKIASLKLNDENTFISTSIKVIIKYLTMAIGSSVILVVNLAVGLVLMMLISVSLIITLFGVIVYFTAMNLAELLTGDNRKQSDLVVTKNILKIKRTLVNELRNTSDKDLSKQLVTQIDLINMVLKNMDDRINYTNRLRVKYKLDANIDNLIEKLSNNDLHYLSKKIKG